MLHHGELKLVFMVYRDIGTWEPENGESFQCFCEVNNPDDRYAAPS